jgi:hypothetical protein
LPLLSASAGFSAVAIDSDTGYALLGPLAVVVHDAAHLRSLFPLTPGRLHT